MPPPTYSAPNVVTATETSADSREATPATTTNVIGMLAASAASDQPMPPPQVASTIARPAAKPVSGIGRSLRPMRKNSSSARPQASSASSSIATPPR